MANGVDVLIPVYGAFDMLHGCLASLYEKTNYPINVYIADDNSPKNLSISGDLTLFSSEINRGFAAINNWATGQIEDRGDYLLLLNSDIEVIREGWLESMVDVLEDEDNVGIVGAKLIYPANIRHRFAGKVQHAGVAKDVDGTPTHPFRGFDPRHPYVNRKLYINAVTGACLLIRWGLWDQLRGFDEAFIRGQFEDVDLCWRARQIGWKVVYQPEAELLHHEHGSGLDHIKKYGRHNAIVLGQKWPHDGRTDIGLFAPNKLL